MAGWSSVACDNIVVKWHGSGRSLGSRMTSGKGVVLLVKWQVGLVWPVTTLLLNGTAVVVIRQQCVDWAASYKKGQDNRIGESAKLDHQGWSNRIGS